MTKPLRHPIDEDAIEVRRIASADPSAGLCCGVDELDRFFAEGALEAEDDHTARTYVALFEGRLVGFVTILADALRLESSERKRLRLPSQGHPVVPALKIARLAVAADFAREYRGLGRILAKIAYVNALEVREYAGCRILTVDAKAGQGTNVVEFYERLGFVRNKRRVEGASTVGLHLDVGGPRAPTWAPKP